ncbi:MAG: hypothetical protein IJ297_05710 [Clostridia bacterium]|nr:hypothetical protein [Clostridia bacterium]
MKIFIGGSRGIKNLDRTAYCFLEALYKVVENKENNEVLIGDANGVDLPQKN